MPEAGQVAAATEVYDEFFLPALVDADGAVAFDHPAHIVTATA